MTKKQAVVLMVIGTAIIGLLLVVIWQNSKMQSSNTLSNEKLNKDEDELPKKKLGFQMSYMKDELPSLA